MRSKHRQRSIHRTLGIYHLTYTDIVNLEKIIKKYIYYTDFYIDIGRNRWEYERSSFYRRARNSIHHHKKHRGEVYKYLKINADPDFYIEFTPRKTEMFAKRDYTTGDELANLNKVMKALEHYLSKKDITKQKHLGILCMNKISI